MRSTTTAVWVLSAVFIASGLPVLAAEAPKMTPEQEKMMAEMQKAAAPGENHKRLEQFVGKWTFVSRYTMKPGEKPQESKGTMENSMVYGGRFLKRVFQMPMEGISMEGESYSGYDNVRGEYQDVGFGSFTTGFMQLKGSYDAASKTFKYTGDMSCPMPDGAKVKAVRMELKVVNNDKHVYSMYEKGPDGKEFRSLEETYTRTK
jgi:hypothetical protein